MDAFVEQWKLNQTSECFLRTLSQDLQEDIMSHFSPRDASRDVNAVFQKFAKSRQDIAMKNILAQIPEDNFGELREGMREFIENWKLDSQSQKVLMHLKEEVQDDVMGNFSPQDPSRDVNRLFCSFVRSRSQQHEKHERTKEVNGLAVAGGNVENLPSYAKQFVDNWSLDDQAAQVLAGLPEDILNDVVTTFQPRDLTREVNSVFHAYVRSRLTRSRTQMRRDELQPFFTKWNLGESSQHLLLDLPVDLQQDIIGGFEPRDTTRDVNGLFQSFARSRGAKTSVIGTPQPVFPMGVPDSVLHSVTNSGNQHDKDALNQFCAKWNLNQASQSFLMSLPPDVRRRSEIMEKFAPKDTERDVNSVFLAFARSRVKTLGSTTTSSRFGSAPVRGRGGIAAFCSKWNLGAEAMDTLRSLSDHVQDRVMEEFSPRDTSRDVNRVFVSFAVSRAALIFGDTWRLNETAMQALKGLDQATQMERMRTFAPRDSTKDVNNLFLSFLKSRGNATSGPPERKGVKRGLDKESGFKERWNLNAQNVELLNSLDASVREDLMASFNPRDTARDVNAVFGSFAKSRLGRM